MKPPEHITSELYLKKSGWLYWTWVIVLLGFIAYAAVAWFIQLRDGHGVTGLSDALPWGVYIVNFVFFVGISYAGTLLSAVLRLIGAEWHRPITRIAEIVTVVSLIIALVMIFATLGKPLLAPVTFLQFGQVSSPLAWDMIVLNTYLAGAMIFLYLPLIPDIARCRDAWSERGGIRFHLYRALALKWDGSKAQKRRLEKGMAVMAIAIVPVAILAHSVVAWIFGMTVRPLWDSTIFAPYFVVGAVFSGTAVIIVIMAIYRYFWDLGNLFTLQRFRNLGFILLTLNLGYIYFTFSEYLTVGYQVKEGYAPVLSSLYSGNAAPFFWFSIIFGMMVPAALIALPWTRTIGGITFASVLVVVGMWCKRWIIVVTPQENSFTPIGQFIYTPTWIEWAITGGGFAALILAFLVFQRFFPIISVWEVEADNKQEAETETPLPPTQPEKAFS